MFKGFKFHRPHYFSKHPSRGLKELYWSVGLKDLGMAIVTLFEPIFLYTLGYGLKEIVLFYLIIYGTYIFLLPFFGRLVAKIGYEHSIFYSQFLLILYFVFLFSISKFSVFFFIAPFISAFYKSMYWPAYHADFVHFSQDNQRGREVGGIETLSMMVYVIGPLLGGLILSWSNFGVLFIVGSALFILSSIPLLRITEVHDKVDFSYIDVFREMFDKKHRRNFLGYTGFGEELIVLTIWPIFIYTVINDYLRIGSLVAVATLITGIIVLFLGKAADKYKKTDILKIGTIIYFISWLVRGFAKNAWQVFSLDTVSRFSKEMLFIPLEAITYGRAKKFGILSYVVFFEQSLAVAKALTALLLLLILYLFASPWIPIFILAGLFSLCYLFIKEK